jgi:hypothetical protein
MPHCSLVPNHDSRPLLSAACITHAHLIRAATGSRAPRAGRSRERIYRSNLTHLCHCPVPQHASRECRAYTSFHVLCAVCVADCSTDAVIITLAMTVPVTQPEARVRAHHLLRVGLTPLPSMMAFAAGEGAPGWKTELLIMGQFVP